MMQYFFYSDIIYYLGMLRPNTGKEKLDLLFLAMCVLIACKKTNGEKHVNHLHVLHCIPAH